MASSSSSSSHMLTLLSEDNEQFIVEESIAVQSVTIKNLVEDDCAENAIPLPKVTGRILAMVIEYWKNHADSSEVSEDEQKKFDSAFVEKPMSDLFDLILAANYLNIKNLMDITCQKVADNIKYKSPEEVREIFNVENDFTPEEEAEVRQENAWAFQ